MGQTISRRQFIGAAAMAGAALSGTMNALAAAQAPDWDEKNGAAPPAPDAPQALPTAAGAIPIIDSHIHLFDQTRPVFTGYTGGLFYRALNKPSTPATYAALARPAGIVGAIVVESAAQFIDDNLWYLEVSRDNPIMVGVSGNIDPGSNDFAKYLNHFHRDPLYRAIRSSRFYSADSGKVALNPAQVANLKLLAQADLALDTANPSMNLMQANVLLADAIPDLRIIMDHLPSFDPRRPGPMPAGLRRGGEGDGGAAQHLRQTHGGISSRA